MLSNLFPGGGLGTSPPSILGGGFVIDRETTITFTKTLVWARILDIEGNPIEGAKIRIETQDSSKSGTYVVATDALTLVTNELGYAEAYVVTGTILKITSRSIRRTMFLVNTTGETNINLADYCAA